MTTVNVPVTIVVIMGIYVTDGVLLGMVAEPDRIKKDSFLEIQGYLDNTLKLSGEMSNSTSGICVSNNPYKPNSKIYVGFFWKWSERSAFSLDDKWTPLYLERHTEEKTQEEKHKDLREKLFETLQGHIDNLQTNEIKLYEVRFYS